MEQNIVNQSKKYLSVAGDTIQAKRGRNVEKYRKLYEEAEVLYGDLKTCIYSLNNEQFIRNTDNYYSLLSTFKYMEMISIIILVVIAFTNIKTAANNVIVTVNTAMDATNTNVDTPNVKNINEK